MSIFSCNVNILGQYFQKFQILLKMPPKKSKEAWFRDWIGRLNGNSFYSINSTKNGKGIYCEACQQQVNADQFTQLQQHNKTANHQKNVHRRNEKENRQKQQFMEATTSNIPDQSTFDLTTALISANIPFNKIENKGFKDYLEKLGGKSIPRAQTLWNYLEHCFKQKMDKIREDFAGAYYWISVDETTDKNGRFIANLLISKLDGQRFNAPHLIAVKALEKTDSGTVARFVEQGLANCKLEKENALMLCTDAAAYMKKACKDLKVFYPNALHVTCLAHALHRVAEKIRELFPNVDRLIAKTKAVFVKAPYRVHRFRELQPDIPLVPKPVLTRWGTWIDAAIYYWQHFQAIKAVVDTFDPNDAVSIHESQCCFIDSVWQDLAYIQSNFGNLSQSITTLEKHGLTIHEQLEVFANVRNEMDTAIGIKADQIRDKFNFIVSNNPGVEIIAQFCQILSGQNSNCDVAPNLIPFYKYAPLTSCDVERSFSMYKSTLADNRMRFSMKNLEMYLICNFNQA